MDFPYGDSLTHSLETPHSVGPLWTIYRVNAENSTGQHTTRDKISGSSGIPTHNPSKRASEGTRLRTRDL